MKYAQISELLNGIAERFDWEKIMEGENIIGLKQVFLKSFVFKSAPIMVFLHYNRHMAITCEVSICYMILYGPSIFLVCGRESKAYHWSLEVNLSLVVLLLKLCTKLVPRLIHIFIRFVQT